MHIIRSAPRYSHQPDCSYEIRTETEILKNLQYSANIPRICIKNSINEKVYLDKKTLHPELCGSVKNFLAAVKSFLDHVLK